MITAHYGSGAVSVENSQGRLFLINFESYTIRYFLFFELQFGSCYTFEKSFAYTVLIITIFPWYCVVLLSSNWANDILL